MNDLMDLPHDLMMLVEVVEAGGFTAASQRTGIPKSRLSRRISALEKRLGVALLVRSARQFEVTELGQHVFARGLKIRDEMRATLLITQDSRGEPSGTLRIACPAALSALFVGDVAIAFARENPRVCVVLKTTDGTVPDEKFDLLIQPVRQALSDSSMVAHQLMIAPYVVVASPELLEINGIPTRPIDLAGWPAIGWSFDENASKWTLFDSGREAVAVSIKVRFHSDSLLGIRKAALAGLGVARLPKLMCQKDVEDGTLAIVLPAWAPAPMAIHALYPSRHHLTHAGRLFLTALSKALPPRTPSTSASMHMLGT